MSSNQLLSQPSGETNSELPLNDEHAPAEMKQPKPPSIRLSPSQASTYRQCPKRWEFRYIHKLPDPPGEAAILGSFVHQVLEDLMKLKPDQRTDDAAKQLARKIYDENLTQSSDYKNLKLNEAQAKEFRWTAWKSIEGVWKLEDPSQVNIHSTEKNFSLDLDGIPFRGIVDRIDNSEQGLIVLDYKTGKAPTSEKAKDEKLDQVFLYAAAVREKLQEKPAEVKMYFLKAPNSQSLIVREATEQAMDLSVHNLKETYLDIQKSQTSETFEVKPGPLCGWCAYADRCEEGKTEVLRRYSQGTITPLAPALISLGIISKSKEP